MALNVKYQTYILTLDATAQQLSALITGPGLIEWAELTALRTNVNPIYHAGYLVQGGSLTSTNYGGYIPAPASGVPAPPYRYEASQGRLDYIQVLGTNGEKLCLNVRVMI